MSVSLSGGMRPVGDDVTDTSSCPRPSRSSREMMKNRELPGDKAILTFVMKFNFIHYVHYLHILNQLRNVIGSMLDIT